MRLNKSVKRCIERPKWTLNSYESCTLARLRVLVKVLKLRWAHRKLLIVPFCVFNFVILTWSIRVNHAMKEVTRNFHHFYLNWSIRAISKITTRMKIKTISRSWPNLHIKIQKLETTIKWLIRIFHRCVTKQLLVGIGLIFLPNPIRGFFNPIRNPTIIFKLLIQSCLLFTPFY